MDSRGSVGEDGSSSPQAAPPLRRRLSMEDDMLYQHLMTLSPRRPSQPSQSPPYHQLNSSLPRSHENANSSGNGERKSSNPDNAEGKKTVRDLSLRKQQGKSEGKEKGKGISIAMADKSRMGDGSGTSAEVDQGHELLPNYSNSIAIEGVFSKKHEIEDTIKRAEDRQWHTVFVTLNGTALSIYNVKKDWGWGKSRDGPSICPDNPPWIRKSKLEKTYSLLHADAGIAADYKKRRYVIRIRAETDQFLLSCIELSTFIKWLECLFAAIDVAAPIDDRDFPRDMSIPRIQRIRWFRNHTGGGHASAQPDSEEGPSEQQSSSPQPLPQPTPAPPRPHPSELGAQVDGESAAPHPRIDPLHRLSISSYPNPAIDPHTGKWFPEHQWSRAHDLLYAKLCYSNLLFRSPRKSNYIISKGKQWFVDWGTGRMVRVLPPAYGEVDYFGPWQVIHTENIRI